MRLSITRRSHFVFLRKIRYFVFLRKTELIPKIYKRDVGGIKDDKRAISENGCKIRVKTGES